VGAIWPAQTHCRLRDDSDGIVGKPEAIRLLPHPSGGIHGHTYCQRFGSVLRLLLHPTRSHRNREGQGKLMSQGLGTAPKPRISRPGRTS
jgi:hypothetical protein